MNLHVNELWLFDTYLVNHLDLTVNEDDTLYISHTDDAEIPGFRVHGYGCFDCEASVSYSYGYSTPTPPSTSMPKPRAPSFASIPFDMPWIWNAPYLRRETRSAARRRSRPRIRDRASRLF